MNSKKEPKTKSKNENQELNLVKAQLARALADYDNLRKRVETEREMQSKIASMRIVMRLLAVLDILNNAQKHLADQGLAIGLNEFRKILNEEELEEVSPKIGEIYNQEFDEIVDVVEGKEDGKIIEVVLTGWRYKDGPVLRHAKVKVEKGKTNLTN